jgi:hypothetical protein
VLLEASAYTNDYLDNTSLGQEMAAVHTALRPVPYPYITGMQLNADVSINGLVLNTIDENNVVWVCTDIQGWWGHAPSEIQDVPRGLGDGSYDVNGRYTARQIELTGVILPPNTTYLQAAKDKLIRAVDLVRSKGWLLTDEGPTRGSMVRLSGTPTFLTVNARGRTEFSIGLKSADPIKYQWDYSTSDGYTSVSATAGSTATANNIGNTNVTGVFKLTGPISANSVVYNLTTGKQISMLTALQDAGASVGTVTGASRTTTNGVTYATLTLSSAYKLAAGDIVTVASVGYGFDGTFTVYSTSVVSSGVLNVTYVNPGTIDYVSGSVRTNLVTNPSFELNNAGWSSGQTGGVAQSNTFAYVGTYSGKTIITGSDTNIATWNTPIISGTTYTYSTYTYVPTGSPFAGRTLGITLEGAGVTASNVTTTSATLVAGSWARSSIIFTATSTATFFFVHRYSGAVVANTSTIYTDGVLLEQSSALDFYFSGAASAAGNFTYAWTGTANASTSTATFSPTGPVTLTNAETLTVDTYTKSVLLNSNTQSSRERLSTLVDWITLQPGINYIKLVDSASVTTGTLSMLFRSGWIG